MLPVAPLTGTQSMQVILGITDRLILDLRGAGVEDWDYWGMAPDSQHPAVGMLWLTSATAPSPSNSAGSYRFSVEAAFWAVNPDELRERLYQYLESLGGTFGDRGCPKALTKLGYHAKMGVLTVSPPSTSAASSASSRPGGLWSVVSTSIEVS